MATEGASFNSGSSLFHSDKQLGLAVKFVEGIAASALVAVLFEKTEKTVNSCLYAGNSRLAVCNGVK